MIVFIIVFISFIIFYIRWKHPFWSIQPVNHHYDIFFWGRTKEIRRELPKKNKFFNPDIVFQKDDIQWDDFQKLISRHFLNNNGNTFTPSINELKPYFIGHSLPSYISFMYKDELVYENKSKKKLIATITSRPLTFHGKTKMTLYYVDYLCVNKQERGKRITPQMIQTHEYNQSHHSKTQVSLFRREGTVPLLVPFVRFRCTIFSMVYWKEVTTSYKLIRITKNNIHSYLDFIDNYPKEFMIKNDIGNILELIKTENIIIYLCLKDKFSNAYFFRKSCTKVDGKDMLTLYASLKTNDDFIHLFKSCLTDVVKRSSYVYLSVEEIGDNIEISNNLREKTFPTDTIDCGYYFYNYTHKTVKAQKCFILT